MNAINLSMNIADAMNELTKNNIINESNSFLFPILFKIKK